MNMIMPSFFLFAIYASVNVWFPLFLRNMNYSVMQVGLLLSVFEVFGVIIPFFTGNIPAKNGKYGLFLCLSGFVLALIPLVLFSVPLFSVTALCLGIYAVFIKGAIPVSDTFINIQLGTKSNLYGRIRAVGSLGFVCANIIMQRFIRIDSISAVETVLWVSIPALLFSLSLIIIPGLLKPVSASYGTFSGTDTETQSSDVQNPFREEYSGHGREGKKARIGKIGFFNQFSPRYWLVLILIFLTTFGQVPTFRFLSIYVKEFLHSDAAGILWIISALSEIPFMFFSSRFIRRWGSLRLILFAALVSSVRNVMYVIFPTVWGAAAAQMCNSVTFGLFHPAAVMFVARHVRRKEHLVLSQLLYSVVAVGSASVLASALGGFVVDRFGYSFLYISYAAFPLAGILLFFIFDKKTRQKY